MDTPQGTCSSPTNAPQTRVHIAHSGWCCRTAPREKLFAALCSFPEACTLCSCRAGGLAHSLSRAEHLQDTDRGCSNMLKDTSFPAKLQRPRWDTSPTLPKSSATCRQRLQSKILIFKRKKKNQHPFLLEISILVTIYAVMANFTALTS